MITLEIGGRSAVVIGVHVAVKLLSLGATLRPLAHGALGLGAAYTHELVPPPDDGPASAESERWVVSTATLDALRFLGVPLPSIAAAAPAPDSIAATFERLRSTRPRARITVTSGLGPLGLGGPSIPFGAGAQPALLDRLWSPH